MRLGRNYFAVAKSKDLLKQYNHYEMLAFSAFQKVLNSTYSAIFDENLGGLVMKDNLEKLPKLKVARHFFDPLVTLTRDPSLSQIFNDYLAMFLLKHGIFTNLLRRSKFGGKKSCSLDDDSDAVKYCSTLVSTA